MKNNEAKALAAANMFPQRSNRLGGLVPSLFLALRFLGNQTADERKTLKAINAVKGY